MKFTNIQAALEWVDNLENTVQADRFERVNYALNLLGNPHVGLPVIHITGTNGKGSTTSYLKNLLQSQGLKVGTFTSPHIMRLNERFSYDGQDISDDDLLWLINEMYVVNQKLDEAGLGQLVFFELYTVMVCLYFDKVKPDVCLIEVGIGGRHDSTNVIDGQIAVITTIGLDHGDIMEQTIANVAYEKAGIIKHQASVVIGPLLNEARVVIEEQVAQEQASLYVYDEDFVVDIRPHERPTGSDFTFTQNQAGNLVPFSQGFEISMLGRHQVQNASVALESFMLWMSRIDQPIDWIKAGLALKETKWIARMECMSKDPMIYIDGAHNSSGLWALSNMLEEYFSDYEITLIYAGLSTKLQSEQIPILLKMEPERFVLTDFSHAKAMQQSDFMKTLAEIEEDSVEKIEFDSDWKSLITDYLESSVENQKRLLLVTGSLYFVSEVRQFLQK